VNFLVTHEQSQALYSLGDTQNDFSVTQPGRQDICNPTEMDTSENWTVTEATVGSASDLWTLPSL